MDKQIKEKKNLFSEVYDFVRTIPVGKVATYGQVAERLGIKDIRKVGWALHANRSSEVPCHRVVNKEGRLAENFAFDGAAEQRKRLLSEGVNFIDDMHVNLKSSLLS